MSGRGAATAAVTTLLAGEHPAVEARLKAARLGLLTNDLALTDHLVTTREALLAAGWRIERLFSPEHGLTGRAREGELVDDGLVRGLPVRSLYGDAVRPSPADLDGLDAVLVDLPDVGARFYTYAWTTSHLLEACADAGVAVVVLDRPNPLGGDLSTAEGPVLEEDCASLVGRWPLPVRHGLTLGELCRHWARTRGIDVALEVVPAPVEDRATMGAVHQDPLGGTWTPPSPNMPSPLTALLYPGTCLAEGVNLAEGRSTAVPFRVVAAPFLDGARLADAVREARIPGLAATPYGFTPLVRDHAGAACEGVLLHVTDPAALRPVSAGVRLLSLVAQQVGDQLVERALVPMPGESDATPLEKLFGRRGAFTQITGGEWDDARRFAVLDWPDAVGADLLYR